MGLFPDAVFLSFNGAKNCRIGGLALQRNELLCARSPFFFFLASSPPFVPNIPMNGRSFLPIYSASSTAWSSNGFAVKCNFLFQFFYLDGCSPTIPAFLFFLPPGNGYTFAFFGLVFFRSQCWFSSCCVGALHFNFLPYLPYYSLPAFPFPPLAPLWPK